MHYSLTERGQAAIFVFLILASIAVGVVISYGGIPRAVSLVGAMAIFAIAFISTEAALYILIFSMLLSPEISVGTTSGASLGRGVTLRVDDFLLVVIGFSWFVRSAIHKELGLFIRTPVNRQIYVYIFVSVAATALGMMAGRVDFKTGFFFVLKYFEYFVIYFMVANHLRSEKQLRNFLTAMFVTAAIVSLNALRQIPAGGRVSAPFEGESGEPNTFGGYLLLMMAISGALLLTRGSVSSRTKYILSFLILMMFTALLFTLSRSSWLALIPTYFVFMLYSDRKRLLAGVLIGVLFLGPFVLPDLIKSRVKYTFSKQYSSVYVGNVPLDPSTSARLKDWGASLRDVVKKPLLGYGVTGYRFLDAQYFRVLAETGILGIIAFLWLLFSLLRFGMDYHRLELRPFRKALYLGFTASMVGMMAHSIGSNTFIIVRIMEPFWFFAGLVISLPRLSEEVEEEAESEPEAERFLRKGV